MTNLFTHLAARSLGLTPIVQPRIDSMFSARTAAEPIESAFFTTSNQPENQPESNQPESNRTNAIAELFRREDTAASLLVNPAVNPGANPGANQSANQNLPPLPIAHAPRPIALEKVTEQTADRARLSRDQPVFDEVSVRGDRPVSEISVQVPRTKNETDFNANHAADREPTLNTNTEKINIEATTAISIETNREIRRRTNQLTDIQDINSQNISQNIRNTAIEPSSPAPPPAATVPSSLREMPKPPGSVLPVAEMTPSPQSIPAAIPGVQRDAGDRLDAEVPLDRSSRVQATVQETAQENMPVRPEPLEREPIARSQSQIAPRTVSRFQPVQPARTEIRSGMPEVLPTVQPRQTVSLPPVSSPVDRSAVRGLEQEAPAALPTIRVTIGRIEVRAVSTPAPARPRTATTPARLSLEDYLRSRSGGNP